MLIKSFFAGFGGQGVLMMGYALAYAGMMEDKNVTYLPAYGAEVRGGTAHCTVAISDEEIASPVASAPEFVVVMNSPSMIKFQNTVQSGGALFINSTLVEQRPIRGDIEVFETPATAIAESLGNIRTANMVMLGAFVKQSKLVSIDTLLNNLGDIFGAKKKKLIDINITALKAGYDSL
jgi:2-oxoglutarate ferredoxin oxidoreductase subunit gamma